MNMKDVLSWAAVEKNRQDGSLDELRSFEVFEKMAQTPDTQSPTKSLWDAVVSDITRMRQGNVCDERLFLAVLLRQVGRVMVKAGKEDKWAQVGGSWVRSQLHLAGASLELREAVSNLISYQEAPLGWKSTSAKTVCRLSHRMDLGLLASFFDLIHADEGAAKIRNAQTRMQKLIEGIPRFADDEERYRYFNNKAPKVFKGRLIMMMGLQGSGKDWYIREHLSQYPMISLDNIRIELGVEGGSEVMELAEHRIRGILKDGGTVVYNATNTHRFLRKKWLEVAKEYDARTEIIYIHAPFEQQLAQNVLSDTRSHTVPEKAIIGFLKNLSMPDIDEAVSLTMYDNSR